MAIVLPVVLLLTLGTLETCEAIFLLQKIEIAAQEGAREAIRRDATIADVENAVGDYLQTRGITTPNLSMAVTSDPRPEMASELDPVRVTVTIPTAGNFRMPIGFYRFWTDNELSAEVVMFKEYTPLPQP